MLWVYYKMTCVANIVAKILSNGQEENSSQMVNIDRSYELERCVNLN